MVWLFLQLLCREVFAWALQAGVSGQVGSNFGQAHRDKSYKDSHHNGHIGMLTTWNLHSEDPIVDKFHCTFSHVMKTSRRFVGHVELLLPTAMFVQRIQADSPTSMFISAASPSPRV